MSMIQAGMIGVIGAMLAIQLKGSKAEYGIYVSVAVSIVLFVLISDRLGIFVRTVKELIAYAHLETSYFSVILKMVGITYIAEFASGICKDAGYQTIAGQIETFRCLGYGACFINSQDILNLLYFHRYHLGFLNDLHKKYTSL